MTEWTVVTVVIALVGFLAAVIKPIITLNTNITKLTAAVSTLQENLEKLTTKNNESHDRIWCRLDEHTDRLSEHETRLLVAERKVE